MSLYDSWTIFLHSPCGDWDTYRTVGCVSLTLVYKSRYPIHLFNHYFTAVLTSLSVLNLWLFKCYLICFYCWRHILIVKYCALINYAQCLFFGLFVSKMRNIIILSIVICLFICSLFNDTFSSSDYIVSNERTILNNELERMWKEAVVA
jgi:hypothetical protein